MKWSAREWACFIQTTEDFLPSGCVSIWARAKRFSPKPWMSQGIFESLGTVKYAGRAADLISDNIIAARGLFSSGTVRPIILKNRHREERSDVAISKKDSG